MDPLWHLAGVGEIFHTDGILRKELYRPYGVYSGIRFYYD